MAVSDQSGKFSMEVRPQFEIINTSTFLYLLSRFLISSVKLLILMDDKSNSMIYPLAASFSISFLISAYALMLQMIFGLNIKISILLSNLNILSTLTHLILLLLPPFSDILCFSSVDSSVPFFIGLTVWLRR